MEIKKVTLKDYKSIQSLSKQLGYDMPVEHVNKRLDEILSRKDHKIFGAFDPISNKLIGYIHVQVYKTLYLDDLLNILGIIVDKSYRDKGVGSALLNEAENFAIMVNCAGIRAISGSARTNAHVFYKKNGFDSNKDPKRFIKLL